MRRPSLLWLAKTVAPRSFPCQGSLRQLGGGLLGVPGTCYSARLLGGTATWHDASAASHAEVVSAAQPEHGLRTAGLLHPLPEQVAQSREQSCGLPRHRMHTNTLLPTPVAPVPAGSDQSNAPGQRQPVSEPMHEVIPSQECASCARPFQEELFVDEAEEGAEARCVEHSICLNRNTLPYTQRKGCKSHPSVLQDRTADDSWYSLSPNFIDSKLPIWKKWRLNKRRSCPPDQPLGIPFREQLAALGSYREVWGDCLVPRRWWQDWRLGEWVADVRHAHKEGRLTPTQIRALDASGFTFKLPAGVADWNHLFHELRRFRQEHGQEGPEFKWRDPLADFTNNFAKWYHQQPELFKQRLLLPDQVWKLRQIGWDMHKVTGDDITPEEYGRAHVQVKSGTLDHEFETMYAKLKAWRDAYGTTMVPKQVYDNVVLGAWVHRVRKQGRDGRLPASQVAMLDKLLFVWKVDLQSAIWHYLLHEARRYKEVHGHAMIPVNYCNPNEVGWVQAARWITRNAKLFSKGKLTDKRYQLIRDVLGIKFVKKIGGPSRRGGGNRQLAADARPLGPWNLYALAE